MKLYIKYMVSLRCKMYVKEELRKSKITFSAIDLGVVDIADDATPEQIEMFGLNLEKAGLELISDKKQILVEKIKNVIVEMVHYSDDEPKVNDSNYISEKLGYDYTYLSNIFTEVKGFPIQQFIIINRIERVKELLLYDELTLTEIAWRLHYSSVAHLSNQFKKVTGHTPTEFKSLENKKMRNLENL